jgi:membrane-bound lytic murein transglycosylase D
MQKTISKTRLLNLFLISLAAQMGGCSTVPDTKNASSVISPKDTGTALQAVVTAPTTETITVINPYSTEAEAARADAVANDGTLATPEDDQPAIENENSLWRRIRAGLRVPKLDDDRTRAHERWIIENAEFRQAMFGRAKLYLYYIVEEVDKRNMPMEIALLPAIESAYKPYAYSRARASGLWQFIPSTGRLYGLKSNWWYDGRRDVVASTRAALDYLQKLHDDFGDWHLALAAYNAGEGRIARAVAYNKRKGLPTDYSHLKTLKPETRNYVPKLLAMVNIITNPNAYGVQLPEIPNEPYFASIETDSQIDLGVIARLTGMDATDLHYINPGYVRWATDPDGPHQVLVPADKKDLIIAGLENIPDNERVEWRYHNVQKGDTLHGIARKHRVTVDSIKIANKLRGPIRVGQNLLLPISANAVALTPPRTIRAAVQRSSDGTIIHRVRRGDTLWSIAKRYGVPVQQLAKWNRMETGDVLRAGQRLRIYKDEEPPAA